MTETLTLSSLDILMGYGASGPLHEVTPMISNNEL